jgi:hypothetical protein
MDLTGKCRDENQQIRFNYNAIESWFAATVCSDALRLEDVLQNNSPLPMETVQYKLVRHGNASSAKIPKESNYHP